MKKKLKFKVDKTVYTKLSIFLIIIAAIIVLIKTQFFKKSTPSDAELTSEATSEIAPSYNDYPVSSTHKTIMDYEPGSVISPPPSNELSEYFSAEPIPGDVFDRIYGKSYVQNDKLSINGLRYLMVLHYNFQHEVQIGELIVNKEIADMMLEIFQKLYEAEYEIQSLVLVDNYWIGNGDSSDYTSTDNNNSSAYCYRMQTNGEKLSYHGLGLAIDINPQQNPYVSHRDGVDYTPHKNAEEYIDRQNIREHMISHDDFAYQLFTSYGFIWGGDWDNVKDYQHFEIHL